MGKILDLYLSNFITRFDKDGIVPFLSHSDFEGLQKEEHSFVNSDNNKIAYFFYHYDDYKPDKLILFLHGIGPGHTAYMSEINTICKQGYRVLTLDYTGCDKSGGNNLHSINQPTKDVDELLKELELKEELIILGHSLGGYTAINTANLNQNVSKTVVISGFISLKNELNALMKIPFLSYPALKYEKNRCNGYNNLNNFNYLKNTSDKFLFIHSLDDKMVPYKSATGFIKKTIKNDNLSFLIVKGKKHNPNYTVEAVKYMTETFADYYKKIKNKELDSYDEKKSFMSDKSALKMTIQDCEVWNKIFEFIEEK